MMGRPTATAQILILFLEIGFLVYLLIDSFEYLSEQWHISAGLLAGSSILINIASGIRIGYTMDFYKKPCGLLACVSAHIIQLGPLWRYFKLLSLYESTDNNDFMKLKLFHHCTFSAPILIYLNNIYILDTERQNLPIMISLSYISIVTTLTHFSNFTTKEKPGCATWMCTFLWRIFMLFSRFSALVCALSSRHSMWVILIIGIHFLVIMIWYQLRELSDQNDCTPFRVWLLLLALANTIDLTISDYKVPIEWLVGYYTLTLSENIGMVAMWYSSITVDSNHYNTLWLVAVFASFALGLLLALTSLTLRNYENKKQALQRALKCCCPGSRRDDIDRAPFVWDSYDVKRKKTTCVTNKGFEFEERQKHVDIINNPLGISGKDITSLSTPGTNPTSPVYRTPNTISQTPTRSPEKSNHRQIKVEINRQRIAAISKQMTPQISPTLTRSPIHQQLASRPDLPNTVIPSAFLLSPTGLRAQQQNYSNTKPIDSSSTPTNSDSESSHSDGDEYSTLTGKITPYYGGKLNPRRRLLFITPPHYHKTSSSSSNDRNTYTMAVSDDDVVAKSASQHDLRPRWVDLNKYYRSLYSSESAVNALTLYEDELPVNWNKSKVMHDERKVKSRQHERDKSSIGAQRIPKTMFNFRKHEFETQL